MSEVSKLYKTVKVQLSTLMAYRFDFIAFAIAPAVLFFVIKYNLFLTIYDSGYENIAGYNLKQMIQYQGYTLIIALFTQTFSEKNLIEDIRYGRITAYLLYPFSFWSFHFSNFIANYFLQFLITIFTTLVLLSTGIIFEINFNALPFFFILILQVGLFLFLLRFFVAILSFWYEETWTIRVIMLSLIQLLSGAIFPLEMFPQIYQDVLAYTPFPYLTFYPVKMLTESYSALNMLRAIVILLFWMSLSFMACRWMWGRGVKSYTAAGM